MNKLLKWGKFVLLLILCVRSAAAQTNVFEYREGGIVRGAKEKKQIALEFTADTFSTGAETILDQLERHNAKASFFLTGNFLRKPENKVIVQRIVRGGHYLGPHSDKHPLYAPWSGEKKTIITQQEFNADLANNLREIERFGVKRSAVKFWIPPYEWYNDEIVQWSRGLGLTLINFTPGTRSSADYTENDAKNFVPAQTILDSIINKEKKDGLNGFLLLLHFGVSPKRTDLMADRVGELFDYLQAKEYKFVRVDQLLTPAVPLPK
ncbi:MAG: polysaccharide deacetylase family protein [Verrucomicrobiales bacterium]|nr:polysaccharide deacetylase family protein [Verrucomicrobiales bacterium]